MVRVPRASERMSDGAVALEAQSHVAKCSALSVTLRSTSSECAEGLRACHRADMQGPLLRYINCRNAN